ncbi:unnamed protein product, partial [Closterium sp. NIES-54]
RDYELHSLDFSTAFLQGSLHEEIWLRRPPGFTRSFPPGTQWSLRRPVYGLRQAPHEWHDTLRTTLAALGFAPSSADPSLFLRTDTSLLPFYILVYVDDLAFATADTAGLAHVKSEMQKRHTCTDLGELRSYLGLQITRDRAQRTITLTQSHMVQQNLQRFDFTYSSPQATPLSTRHSLSALPSDESVEPSGPYPELVGCLIRQDVVQWEFAPNMVLHDVLLVPDLKANLISLRKLAKAGVSTSTDGARTYKGQLGNRVLWDLHESKDVYRSMWQLPALAWHGGGQAGEGSASQGECNAVGGVGVKVSAISGMTDWATAHRRLGHVAMPLLKQLEKDGAVKGLKLNGQPPDDNCEICLLSKFTRFPFHSVNGRSKKPLELVHMDLVGPLPVQGHKGERYFLTIVDDWSRLMWAYPLKQKDHAASTIKEDWLPFVEKQAECVVKRIRTDRGGEFLGAEMKAWLKKQRIQRELTTAYSPQSNGVAERANRTILETARALLIESGVGNSMWPHAVRHATVARNRVLTKVGNESWVPLERWLGRKPPVDMLRVFGCMAVAHVPKKYRSKLGASAIWCVHLGLAAESKGCVGVRA